MKQISIYLLLAVFTSLQWGCSNQQNQTNNEKLSGDIRIDGSSTVFPITEAVAEEFRRDQPEVKVTVGVSGTGGGFKKFCRGEIDIADASRKIKDAEAASCVEGNISYLEIPVAFDGLAVVVNPQNTWVDKLTLEELKKIWEPAAQGKIMKWSQIRAGFPDDEIHLFGPGVASGTYDYFTEAIVGKSGSSRGDFTASEDDNVLVQGISGDKFGLGFFGLAYFTENKDKLKLIPVDNGKAVVIPTEETVRNGTYAPLSRPLYIYVNSLAAVRPEVRSFVNFYLKNGSSLAREVGYIPMPEPDYAAQIELFKVFSEKIK